MILCHLQSKYDVPFPFLIRDTVTTPCKFAFEDTATTSLMHSTSLLAIELERF